VPAYRQESGISPESRTETYTALEFRIENWRWAGVPFRSYRQAAGPFADRNCGASEAYAAALFAGTAQHGVQPNVIMLRIQPDEGISIEFETKVPGTSMQTSTVHMDFCYEREFNVPAPVAYETLLLDAIRGDATLFTRHDEVEANGG